MTAARKALPPAHWGYLSTGVDDDATLKANREGFSHYQLRSPRLVDTTKIDMSADLFGTKWETPIVLAWRSGAAIASWSAMTSFSGGISSHAL